MSRQHDDLLKKVMGKVLQSFAIINMVSLIVSIIITTVVLFIVITIKTLNSRKQIGILKAIGVDKEVIMHNYGFQVVILGDPRDLLRGHHHAHARNIHVR